MFSVGSMPNLRPLPEQTRQQHTKSPSLQAASLAASRATPQPQHSQAGNIQQPSSRAVMVRKPAAPPKPRELSKQHPSIPAKDAEAPTDNSPIPSTTSLVNLFEQKRDQAETSTTNKPEPIVVKPSTDLAIRSPKPIRTSGGGLTSVFHMEVQNSEKPTSPEDKVVSAASSPSSSRDSFASASESATAPVSPQRDANGLKTHRISRENEVVTRPKLSTKARPPMPPPARLSSATPVPVKEQPSRSATTMSDRLPPSVSLKSLPAQFKQLHPRGKAPQMTGDELANAMVASSLATSRVASPQHPDPSPTPSRRHKHHTFAFSRTPSPTKGGMKHTLRKAESDSETSDGETLHPYGKHKRKRHLRKHPNKHHEGDRKRWRDAVTERERKRYEGVWAANKGLHCSFTRSEEAAIRRSPTSDEAQELQATIGDHVSNIVARDIWQRSRLPEATLETVWDLVDNDCVGRLTKDEFVVAMFLIDYCLKGRKLPVKVGESVWASVKGLQGIKVRKKL